MELIKATLHRLFVLLLLFNHSFGSNVLNANLNDAFLVKRGPSNQGGCDEVINQVQAMFDDVVNMASAAFDSLDDQRYLDNSIIRRNAYAFLSILMNEGSTSWNSETDRSNLRLARVYFKYILENKLQYKYTGDQETKPYLYCNSRFLIWKKPQDPFLDASGLPYKRGKKIVSTQEWYRKSYPGVRSINPYVLLAPSNYHIVPRIANMKIQQYAYWDLDQKGYLINPNNPNHPPDQEGYPTYCANEGYYGWTIDAIDMPTDQTGLSTRLRATIVLCPRLFTDNERTVSVNTTKQSPGTQLPLMEPKALTWLHEMVHLAWVGEASSDQLPVRPKLKNKQLVPEFPRQRKGWIVTQAGNAQAGGAQQAWWLGLFAAHVRNKGRSGWTNPENLAWFGLSNYLWTKTKQDWSSLQVPAESLPTKILLLSDSVYQSLNTTADSFER